MPSTDLVIRGGRCLLPDGFAEADLFVSAGRIMDVVLRDAKHGGEPQSPFAAEHCRFIDATGLLVLPGAVDAHVHTRDPGQQQKEDYAHATRAAAAGGVTTIIAQPNTAPPATDLAGWAAVIEAATASRVDYAICAGIPTNQPDQRVIAALGSAGAVGVEVLGDMAGIDDDGWCRVFEAAAPSLLPLSLLAADRALMNRNTAAARAAGGNAWSSVGAVVDAQAEVRGYRRVVAMSRRFGVPLIVRQVTTAEGLDFLRAAKRQASTPPLWVEVNVHHLFLSGRDRERLGPFAHMVPPLRDDSDIAALWQGIRDGTIDFVSSDHAPHTREEKERGLADPWSTPSGIPGVETMVPLLVNAALNGRLSMVRLYDVVARVPAQMHRLAAKGRIAQGCDADLALVDPNAEWTVTSSRIFSRCGWSAFEGWTGRGALRMTLVRGVIVARDGIPLNRPTGRMILPE